MSLEDKKFFIINNSTLPCLKCEEGLVDFEIVVKEKSYNKTIVGYCCSCEAKYEADIEMKIKNIKEVEFYERVR